jgi:transcriptional regulator with XRE-family HTH domain
MSTSSRAGARPKPIVRGASRAKDIPPKTSNAVAGAEDAPLPARDCTATDEADGPGERLFTILRWRAQQVGHTKAAEVNWSDVARRLGITGGHLSLLRSGARDIRKIGPELIAAIALYTGLSSVQVMYLARQIGPEDFGELSEDEQVGRAVTFILADRPMCTDAARELHRSSLAVKRSFIQLYEAATGYKLLLNPKYQQE